MIKSNYICGIDIGTHTTKVVVVGIEKGKKDPTILATGFSETNGVRFGYINNIDEAVVSTRRAIRQAENTLGSKIKKAYISIDGINLSSTISTGSVIISKADQEITSLDVAKAISNGEENVDLVNKRIIHTIPIGYKLDGKEIHGRPEGLYGIKLEVKILIITCLKQNVDDLITTLGVSGIDVNEIIASPIATSKILLNNKQKIAGCILVDIGSDIVNIAVFENNLPLSVQAFPIGSMDITKDIALGLKVSLEEAESIKLGSVIGGDYSKKKVDEIIEARLIDILELITNHLKKLKRNELLPAGVIFTGGGSLINNIDIIAKNQLKIPTRIGPSDSIINNKYKVKDAGWYTALGLSLYGGEDYIEHEYKNSSANLVKEIKKILKSIFSQLLP